MTEPPAFGTVENACDFLAEMAGGVIAHATIMRQYAEARFYPGLDYSTRCTIAFLRAMETAHAEVERSRAVVAYRKSAENIGSGRE